jgi:predicted AlkP superfamily phosphohydrolase/phosphomutase
MDSPKVLVIGLDGVPSELLDHLFDRGLMPFLQSVSERSYRGSLQSTVPPISATAWATFITGTNPGKHGILQFVKLRPGGPNSFDGSAQELFPGGTSILTADSIRGARLWDVLTSAEKRQIVINVPLTYPPRQLSGTMIAGMMTPPSASIYTYPPELSQELIRAHYETDLSVSEKEFHFDPERLVDRLHEILVKRLDVALSLMASEPWDFSMIVFTGTDRMQHRFWKYLVPGSGEYDSAEAVRLRPQLDRYFRSLDGAVARLMGATDDNTLTIILSDHGFGPVSDRTVYRLSMMRALGLGERGAKSAIGRLRAVMEGQLGWTPDQIRKAARTVLPTGWVAKLEDRARGSLLAASAEDPAYSVTLHEYVGGIYINNSLFADEESEQVFRSELMSGLKALRDPDTGTPVVARVHTKNELYSGPAMEECPDIVFYLTSGYGLSGGVGPEGRIVSTRRSDLHKQGTHRDEGILLMQGKHVRVIQGVREQLMDVTSTILYWLGVPVPISMDSRPILAAFDDGLLSEQPPVYVDGAPHTVPPGGGNLGTEMVEEDAEELLARLRGLGYIE